MNLSLSLCITRLCTMRSPLGVSGFLRGNRAPDPTIRPHDQAGCGVVVAESLTTESPPRRMGSSPTIIRGGVHSG